MNDSDQRDSDRRETRKRELISQEAAEWLARVNVPHPSLDDRRNFIRWLKQSQVHVAEYLRVAELHGGLRRAQLSMGLVDDPPSNVVELNAQEQHTAPKVFASFRWKMAATVAACMLGALLFFVVRAAWYERSIETQPGEWKEVTLADGSELQIGPNTRLKLNLDDSVRAIALVRGEAYFIVAPNSSRPFVVEANDYAIRDIGTEFAVARHDKELIVTVSEGAVRVAPSSLFPLHRAGDDLPTELSVPVHADSQLRIGNTWPVRPAPVDVRYELAWRNRQVMFQAGDTLADAVQEFNRRNRVQLRLDPQVARLPVRGTFDASDPSAFAQTVDKTSPVAVDQINTQLLLIRAE